VKGVKIKIEGDKVLKELIQTGKIEGNLEGFSDKNMHVWLVLHSCIDLLHLLIDD